jgi:adhesin transport system membrane fusion protein
MDYVTDCCQFIAEARANRPRLTGSMLLLLVMGLIVAAVAWAAMTEIDEVTRGSGKVVPSRQVQVVQSFDAGVVKQVLVREGAVVENNELLFVLDKTMWQSEFNQLLQQHHALVAKIVRLTAEIQETEPSFPSGLVASAPTMVGAEQRLYDGRKAELASELKVLDRQLHQRRKELEEAKAAFATAQSGLALLKAEMDIIEPMVKRGIEPEINLLQLRRTFNDLEGERNAAELAIQRLTSAISEVEDKVGALIDRFRAGALQELSDATARIAEIEEVLPAKEERVARTEIRSPVRGIVNRVLTTTIGAVTQPGSTLAEIVPLDDTLLVEAYVEPSDIAFLRPGQKVKVKLTAYDFARYGSLDGELATIGADAIQLPDDPAKTMYPVQVRTEGNIYDALGERLEIIPGMVAEIDILIGKRTILDYFIEPVVKTKHMAFREY